MQNDDSNYGFVHKKKSNQSCSCDDDAGGAKLQAKSNNNDNVLNKYTFRCLYN